MLRSQIIIAALLCFASTGEAFTVTGRSCPLPSSTCLRAEEEEAAPAAEEQVGEAASEDSATDILNSPAFLERKLDVLNSDIAKVEEDMEAAKEQLSAGKAEWGDQLDDLDKEYKNIQERMSAQNKGGDAMATVQVAREMLGVLDNFDRAFGAITPETDEEKAIEAAYNNVYQQILETFKELGVEEVATLGTEFDYEVHQAVMQKPSDEYEEGLVCEEFQKGFKVGDTLVRAAMVAVAA